MQVTDFSQKVLAPLEKTSKKLEQTRILVEFLQSVDATEVAPFLYLVLGQTGPIYANKQYNFGIELMLYALALIEAKGTKKVSLFGEEDVLKDEDTKRILKRRYKHFGDMGLLAQEVVEQAGRKESRLAVSELYDRLLAIAALGGGGSQEEKIRAVAALLGNLDPLSARYVCRMILGHLRLGFSDKTVLDALSWYQHGDKSGRAALDAVYQRHPDIGKIAALVLRGGISAAQKLDAELDVPIMSALCDRLKNSDEAITKMGEIFVEPKYDGTRLQIHWNAQSGELHTFTRNLEENTAMFPELPRLLSDLSVKNCILDAEAVGYNPGTNELTAFQETIKRKRKHDVAATAASIPLRFFVFDLLFLNGRSLLREPLQERRQALAKLLAGAHRDLQLTPQLRTKEATDLREFHRQQLGQGLEGVVLKQVDGPYLPGRQAFNWVKMKEAEGTNAKLTDTIDAVVLGTYAGRGKRATFGVGAFLVGVLDDRHDTIVTIAKIGTGLSDEQWRELKQRAGRIEHAASSMGDLQIAIPEHLQPDVVLPPSLVVEVAADEITKSPQHTAGLALRFPRLVRFRDDKSARDITTLAELKKIKVA